MKDFILKIGSEIRSMPKYEVGRSKRIKFQEFVVEFLGVKDLGKLKDRFEGQYFLDNSWKKLCALDAINQYLNLPEVDYTKLNLRDFQPTIKIANEDYHIICSEFGEFPVLYNEDQYSYVIVYQKNNLEYLIHGIITSKELALNDVVEVSGLGKRVLRGIEKVTMINEV